MPESELDVQLKERFKLLPKVVQDAINSTDVEKHLRDLANVNKLHLDQWQTLENEVMLTLLGIQPVEDLQDNIRSEVGVSADTAKVLAENISAHIFEPIRQQLERNLEHPDAQAATVSGEEAARQQILEAEKPVMITPGEIEPVPAVPATPPQTPNPQPAIRGPVSGDYVPGQLSHERASIADDPYRESPK